MIAQATWRLPMRKPFALQPVLDLMQTRADDATRRLAQLIAAERNAREKLTMLQQKCTGSDLAKSHHGKGRLSGVGEYDGAGDPLLTMAWTYGQPQ